MGTGNDLVGEPNTSTRIPAVDAHFVPLVERERPLKIQLMLPVLLLSTLAATGCEDEANVRDLVDAYADERNAQAEVFCDCHEELGFSDRGACLRDAGQVLPSQRRCIIEAFERNESASKDYLECYLPLEEEFRQRMDDRLTCDDFDAVSPCVDDYNVGARDCIALPAAIERAYMDCF